MKTIHITHQGGGLPLVLFHGWGFDSRIWQSILPMLTQNYEVYCVDLPGFGLSDIMDWDAFKSGLLAELPQQFAVAGWSLGGLVATRLGIEAPERITHLISIASSPCFIEDLPWPGIPKPTLLAFYKRLENDTKTVLNEFMALQVPGQQVQSFASPTIEGLKTGLDWLMWDLRESVSSLQLPVLYIFGRLDSIIPAKTMKVMQERYPSFQYIMTSKAAHALFLSHREMFVTRVTDFLVH